MDVFNFLMPLFTEYGYVAAFVMLLVCGFGVPLPEDITLVTAGVIAGLGYADPNGMVAVGLAGVLVGDGIIFTLGRAYGPRVQTLFGFRRVLTPARFEKAAQLFHKHGKWVMFVARFLPGLRVPVFFSAGMSHRVPFGTWLLMDGSAATVSVPVWVYLGYFGALKREWMFSVLRQFQVGILVVLGAAALVGAIVWWRRRSTQPA